MQRQNNRSSSRGFKNNSSTMASTTTTFSGVSSEEDRKLKFSDHLIRKFQVVKLFRDGLSRINHIDYSSDGTLLAASSDEDEVTIYNCQEGVKGKVTHGRKYGVNLIRFTRSNDSVIHCSTKVDDQIRHLSLTDNTFIRYFRGHTRRVTSLNTSPTDDKFISGSIDKTIRLWDVRCHHCQGYLNVPSDPVVAFDPDGLLFAAGTNSETVRLYDLRSFDKGPFSTFKVGWDTNGWTFLKFSPDGKSIMIGSRGPSIKIIDAFHGTILQTLSGHENNVHCKIEADFTPDSQYVLSGSANGLIHIWNALSGYMVCCVKGDHYGPLHCLKFNPKYMMFATACVNMAFWLPRVDD